MSSSNKQIKKPIENQGKKILVIGTGLSSYGCLLALTREKNLSIDVIDIGLTNSYDGQPNQVIPNSKDINGNYYAYGLNDKRWKIKLLSERLCSSHAYGGFSKVYSGSILQPQVSDLSKWPKQSIPKTTDYRKIISSLKIKYVKDELETIFPLFPNNKKNLLGNKVLIGSSRVALQNTKTKAQPFDVSESFQNWISKGLINYINNAYIIKLEHKGDKITAVFDKSNRVKKSNYDSVYVGAGCVNTTSLVDRSLFKQGSRTYLIKEASILMQLCLKLDFINIFKFKKLISKEYALCKYFLEVKSKELLGYWSHTQIGDLNKIILEKAKLKLPYVLYKLVSIMHGLFNFSQTFLHSELSSIKMTLSSSIQKDINNNNIQVVKINEKPYLINKKISLIIKKAIISKFNVLRLVPLPFTQLIGAYIRGNKLGGWHIGGTLPMSVNSNEPTHCNINGELNGLKNVYIIDSSTFPSIPGSSVALLTMANAHYITRKSLNNIR